MKRFHMHFGVKDFENSILFCLVIFGQKPVKQKSDYAKWLLEDPRLNFAISTRSDEVGVNHVGIQVEEESKLIEITERLKKADLCSYAESKKSWVQDPSGIAWETYQNRGDAEVYTRWAEPAVVEESCCG